MLIAYCEVCIGEIHRDRRPSGPSPSECDDCRAHPERRTQITAAKADALIALYCRFPLHALHWAGPERWERLLLADIAQGTGVSVPDLLAAIDRRVQVAPYSPGVIDITDEALRKPNRELRTHLKQYLEINCRRERP